MRWMEALVERAGSPGVPPARLRLWNAPEARNIETSDAAAEAEWLNRSVNAVLALAVLIVLVPVLLLIALVVKLTSRGAVLYTQERVGLDRRLPGPDAHNHNRTRDLGGRPFTIYKFRTMHVDAERHSGAVWASQADPRVT
ncbi:MAG: sugar transferase, partial [Gemmatimonadales bacterium]